MYSVVQAGLQHLRRRRVGSLLLKPFKGFRFTLAKPPKQLGEQFTKCLNMTTVSSTA